MNKARKLFWDCETMPNIAAVWGKYEQNVLWYEQEGYMFCYAYRWEGESKTHVVSLDDFKSYKKNPRDDKLLIESLCRLFDETDITVAHNGDDFDIKVANGRILLNGLTPPPPSKQVDTLKIAKKYFKLNSNKLDDLGRVLGVGRKERTGGIDLWYDVYHGDEKAIRKMKSYSKQDVDLLQKVYQKLLPWDRSHPNMALLEGRPEACPKCGGGPMIAHKKRRMANVTWKMQYQCKNCGGYSTVRLSEKTNVHYVN